MYNFDSYNVLLAIDTNIPVLLMTAFVLQTHTHTHIFFQFKWGCVILSPNTDINIFFPCSRQVQYSRCVYSERDSMDVCIINTLKRFHTQSLFSMGSGSMGSRSGYSRRPVRNCLNECLTCYLEPPHHQNACAVLFLDGCYHRNEAFAYHTETGLIADRCVTLHKHQCFGL